MKVSSFFADVPLAQFSHDTFRADHLLAERPSIFRGAASAGANTAFSRCIPLFSSLAAIESEALKNFDLASASPEVASNSFMSCNRSTYTDIPVDSVKKALDLVKNCRSSSSSSSSEDASSIYMKLPLVSCPKLLRHLKLEEFVTNATRQNKDEETVTWCDHPMLLRPGSCFAWLYVGQRGSSSPTHVDVMGSDAVLGCFSGKKEWAVVHPFDKHLVSRVSSAAAAPAAGAADSGKKQTKQRGSVEMADLFDIDHERFPHARFARIHYFTQHPGDVVFTPGNACHAVRNVEDSISVTFNFLDRTCGGTKAAQFMASTMLGEGSSSSKSSASSLTHHERQLQGTSPASFTFRLFSPLRRFDFQLRVADWKSTDEWALPVDEWTMRTSAGVAGIHKAAEPIRDVVDRALCCMRAVGATVSETDKCVDYFFECDSDETLCELGRQMQRVEQTALCCCRWPVDLFGEEEGEEVGGEADEQDDMGIINTVKKPTSGSPSRQGFLFTRPGAASGRSIVPTTVRFPQLDSHFGRFFSFPPLCSCLGYSWYFDGNKLTETVALTSEMRHSLKENFGRPVMWHYARYPFTTSAAADAAAAWCKTQLFYSSPALDGPVSLFPLLDDNTLLQRAPLQEQREKKQQQKTVSTASRAEPHFIQLLWNIDALMNQLQSGALTPNIHLLEFGEVLNQRLISNLYMNVDEFERGVLTAGRSLGLDSVPADGKSCADHGVEKILSLVLHLSATPGLVGFRYSHIFSAVREPDTLCLSACAASFLLSPTEPTPTSPRFVDGSGKDMAGIVLDVCRFVKEEKAGPSSSSNAGSATDRQEQDDDDATNDAMQIVMRAFPAFPSAPAKTAQGGGSAANDEGEKRKEAAAFVEKMEKFKKDVLLAGEFLDKLLGALQADFELQQKVIMTGGAGGMDLQRGFQRLQTQGLKMMMLKIAIQHVKGGLSIF